jgi:hypothetical protein
MQHHMMRSIKCMGRGYFGGLLNLTSLSLEKQFGNVIQTQIGTGCNLVK